MQSMSFGLFADFLNSCFSYFSLGFCFSLCNATGKRFRLYFDRKAGCGSLNCKFLDDDGGVDDDNINK